MSPSFAPSDPMSKPARPARLLLLFQGEWEDHAVTEFRRTGELALEREGFDVMHFPGCLRLLHFDARRFADRMCETYRGRIDAVWSNDEQFGCLLAAVVAQRLGLPGADPAAVARAQHKLLLRQTLAKALPHATVNATALPWSLSDRRVRRPEQLDRAVQELGCRWPLFCKPIKGTFSVLARKVRSAAELAAHLRLSWFDRFVLTRLALPYEQLASQLLDLPCPADRMLLEEPIDGQQVNVDGYAHGGEVHILGVVDEWMYPGEVQGARHFSGFTYPSRQPADVQQRLRETAAAAVRAVGFAHGVFNVELFVLADGSVRVIEINPRSAGQFATMYRDVDGLDLERLGVQLAIGGDPRHVARHEPRAGAAASFVFRRFDGTPGPAPSAESLAWLAKTHPHAWLWLEPGSGRVLRREYRWLGSHRHAVLNHAASDFESLVREGEECGRRLFGAAVLPRS